ncbi:hypothetical protein JCGZ_24849 [Jatropha curcas]|uniref:Uncharacterized protein n=1 Tax=Jatropha curcas TaxID=180498 RepID=A0A067L8M6_JATCU|nr:uncharacterized protein LOC105631531 [Jatropha curcas]KDP40850.1 hypothetical protein JCGZ_24849 [Jatropha curcas]
MAEGVEQILQAQKDTHARHENERMMRKDDDNDDNSSNTVSTSSTSDLADDDDDDDDDASSPTSTLLSPSSNSNNGPLFQLSDLMSHLPIKRGLSKYYQGKSQSFTSLSIVTSIEDLPKKESPCRRKMRASKSFGNGLDAYKPYTLPKPIISKKVSRSSLSSSFFPGRRGNSFLNNSRPPLAPILKRF